jgi:hypothetical protein
VSAKEWITVKEAAALTGKSRRTIYEWIDNDRLATRTNSAGITEVLAKAVARIAPTVKRGRPRGVPTRR